MFKNFLYMFIVVCTVVFLILQNRFDFQVMVVYEISI